MCCQLSLYHVSFHHWFSAFSSGSLLLNGLVRKLPDQKSLVWRMVKYPLSENNVYCSGGITRTRLFICCRYNLADLAYWRWPAAWKWDIISSTHSHAVEVKLPIACSLRSAVMNCNMSNTFVLDTRIAPITSLCGSPWQLCPGREQEAVQSVAVFHCQLYRDVDLVSRCLNTDWSYCLCFVYIAYQVCIYM